MCSWLFLLFCEPMNHVWYKWTCRSMFLGKWIWWKDLVEHIQNILYLHCSSSGIHCRWDCIATFCSFLYSLLWKILLTFEWCTSYVGVVIIQTEHKFPFIILEVLKLQKYGCSRYCFVSPLHWYSARFLFLILSWKHKKDFSWYCISSVKI